MGQEGPAIPDFQGRPEFWFSPRGGLGEQWKVVVGVFCLCRRDRGETGKESSGEELEKRRPGSNKKKFGGCRRRGSGERRGIGGGGKKEGKEAGRLSSDRAGPPPKRLSDGRLNNGGQRWELRLKFRDREGEKKRVLTAFHGGGISPRTR